MFQRDVNQVTQWISQKEAWMSKESLGNSIDEVKALMKVQEDFGKSLVPQVSHGLLLFVAINAMSIAKKG